MAGLVLSLEALIARIASVERPMEALEKDVRTFIAGQSNPAAKTVARAGLALVAVVRSDAQEAAEHYPALSPEQGTMVEHNWPIISADRILGLLAHAIGEPDEAAAHFEDALAFCRNAGYRPALAWSLCDYADTLHEHDGDGDRGKAVSLLDGSLATASELGKRPLMERVLSRREHLTA